MCKPPYHNTTKGLTVLTRDPTRTLTLRKKFVSDMQKRFREIKGLINTTVVTNDALGLSNSFVINAAAPGTPGLFDFPTDEAKINAFMTWFQGIENEVILGIEANADRLLQIADHWTDAYIEQAYKQGIIRAQQELKKAGIEPRFDPDSLLSVEAAISLPAHQRRARAAYTRTYNELKGVTNAQDQQISRVLAEGLATGKGPREMARQMNEVVDKMTRTRANVIARTETVRAHHQANIEEYRLAGVEGVKVKAEWVTAGDGAVCLLCEPLEGKVFTLDEIAGLIPRHPNCRCVAIPITPDLDKDKFDGPTLTEDEAVELGESNLNKERKTPVTPGSTTP